MNSLLKKAAKFLLNHRRRKRWFQVVTSLAMVVVFITTYLLILPAITIERKAICGIQEHAHTNTCYIEMKEFVCGSEEDIDHEHDGACYDSVEVLVCDLDEHIHDESCFETEDEDEDLRDHWDSDDLVSDDDMQENTGEDMEFDSEIDFSKGRNDKDISDSANNKEDDAEPGYDFDSDVKPDLDSDVKPDYDLDAKCSLPPCR